MAAFRFRLQPALELAAREERAAQRAWLHARGALEAATASLHAIETQIVAARSAPVRGVPARSAALHLAGERRRALDSERRRASAELARGEREFGVSLARFEEATRRRWALERLRERRRADQQRAEAIRQAREFDEANARSPALAVCALGGP